MRNGVMTEADTCREFVTPKLVEAGWGNAPYAIGEQRSFTNGRIIVAGGKVRRGQQKRADYLLYYRRDYPLAVVEAKEAGLSAEAGVQQAREYAEILGLKFAYATNGHRIIEIDYTTGTEREVDRYAAIKVLSDGDPQLPIGTLVNLAPGHIADEVHGRLSRACQRFLGMQLRALGHVPSSPRVLSAVRAGEPFVLEAPHAEPARQLEAVASRLLATEPNACEDSLARAVAC